MPLRAWCSTPVTLLGRGPSWLAPVVYRALPTSCVPPFIDQTSPPWRDEILQLTRPSIRQNYGTWRHSPYQACHTADWGVHPGCSPVGADRRQLLDPQLTFPRRRAAFIRWSIDATCGISRVMASGDRVANARVRRTLSGIRQGTH